MSWSSKLSWENAQRRAELINNIRMYFNSQAVVEVETPLLSSATITDVYLDGFKTKYDFLADNSISNSAPFYLQTSPEFSMKRLLASGYKDIFQLCKAFRHEAAGNHHNPEFTILEWYRIGIDHFALMADVDALLQNLLACKPATKMSYQEVFIEKLGVDPLTATLSSLIKLIAQHDMLSDWLVAEKDIDVLLQFIFSQIIEPTIGEDSPCFIYDFPSSQASLAKISEEDNRVSHRFECYFKGLELANGFNELTCAKEQYKRFENDNICRIRKSLPTRTIDRNFIAALVSGIPQCSGVALGVDRLIMIALAQDSIKNVITFPIEHA